MSAGPILAIDAGNSRTKWTVFDNAAEPGDALQAHGVFLNAELREAAVPAAWQNCSRAVISNVAGALVMEQLSAMLKPLAITVHAMTPAAHACGLDNGYTDPQQLGSDRWAAAVAAWHRYRAPCVIANAGTALTVDAIGLDPDGGQGIFLGGLIVPGLKLMQQNLVQGTDGLADLSGDIKEFPANTGDAIRTGVLNAMAGAVHSMMSKLQRREGHPPNCLLSGGDATLLMQPLAHMEFAKRAVIVDNLVLQGLLLIERERL